MKYRPRKTPVIEALTWDEFLAYGRGQTGTKMKNDIPWHFEINGNCVTHERDDCYLITSIFGDCQTFTPDDMLIIEEKRSVTVRSKDEFDNDFEFIGI